MKRWRSQTFDGAAPRHARGSLDPALEPHVYQALVMGVRDYVGKNRFPGVLLGLSGGIDSALTLAVAVDALGRDRVRAVMLPSRTTRRSASTTRARWPASSACAMTRFRSSRSFSAFLEALAESSGLPADATEENIQARIRGTLLMALSNKFGPSC